MHQLISRVATAKNDTIVLYDEHVFDAIKTTQEQQFKIERTPVDSETMSCFP
jgi:hypothetical protein